MSCPILPDHPKEFNAPDWHFEQNTPLVDGKYVDRETGEVRVATGHRIFFGPPAVDIVITSLHEDTTQCCWRCPRTFPVETLLWQIMSVIKDRELQLDSLTATPFAIRVILAHELTVDEFKEVSVKMTNGMWSEVSTTS